MLYRLGRAPAKSIQPTTGPVRVDKPNYYYSAVGIRKGAARFDYTVEL